MKNFQLAIFIGLIIPLLVFASGSGSNIDTNDDEEHWVWNDVIGWSNWHDARHNIMVGGNELKGYAGSEVGPIILNCATTPDGDICASYSQPFKVNNDGAGNLSGWAWNDVIGWISFCGNGTDYSTWDGGLGKWVCPSSTTYRVKVDAGYFKDYAWNDIVGWFGFKCEDDPNVNQADCGAGQIFENWRVQTSAGVSSVSATFISNIFDAASSTAAFNTILWQGSQNGGTVEFRIATDNDSTPSSWTYGSWFSATRGNPAQLNQAGVEVIGRRYLRYQARLSTDLWQTASPQVDDIIINYSP